jgi:putative phage-type endonuclease
MAFDAPQGNDAWLQSRLGKITASRLSDLLAKTKSGPAASRANYLAELVAERLTGQQGERFQSAAMAWGTETEPQARAAYSFRRDVAVLETGFVLHPQMDFAGASPDGLVGDDGLLEIKCPNTATHIDYVLSGGAPSKYVPQMQWQLACTGRKWCDFVSFDPRLPEDVRFFCTRVQRDDAWISEAEAAVRAFNDEIQQTIEQLRKAAA